MTVAHEWPLSSQGRHFENAVANLLRDALPWMVVIRHGETQRDGKTPVPDVQVRGVLAA